MSAENLKRTTEKTATEGATIMFTQTIKKHRNWLVLAAILAALAGVFVARTAFARVAANTIDPIAIVSGDGRHLIVTGPIEITPAGERAAIRVTVTQRSTGAVAEGDAFLTSNGNVQHWEVVASSIGKAAFAEGPATAVGLALTTARRGDATDAHRWLVNVTLVKARE
jgi:hypothetical protein